MVSLRVAFTLILLASIRLFAADHQFTKVSYTLSHSPQLSSFYSETMENLRFHLYLNYDNDLNSTVFRKNTSTTSTFSGIFGFGKADLGTSYFTPALLTSFSYKHLQYKWTYDGFWTNYIHYTSMKHTRMFLGFSPEFSFPIETGKRKTWVIAVTPKASLGLEILNGTLGSNTLATGQGGIEIEANRMKLHLDNHSKTGIGFGATFHYERVLHGNRYYGETYGYTIEKLATFPKHSYHGGLFVRWVWRRNGKEA